MRTPGYRVFQKIYLIEMQTFLRCRVLAYAMHDRKLLLAVLKEAYYPVDILELCASRRSYYWKIREHYPLQEWPIIEGTASHFYKIKVLLLNHVY